MFNEFADITHAEAGVSADPGNGNDCRKRKLTVPVQFRLHLGSQLFGDIHHAIAAVCNFAERHRRIVRVVRRKDFQADGCESVDAVFVANNCNLIHKAFSPSLE